MLNLLMEAFTDLNERILTNTNTPIKVNEINKINSSSDVYFSFNDNNNNIRRGTTFNYKAKNNFDDSDK